MLGTDGSQARRVGFQSLHEKLDTTTGGIFVFHVFAALAEFIRTIIVANTNEGLAAARPRGQRLGRPPAMTPEKVAYAMQIVAEPDRSMSSIANCSASPAAPCIRRCPSSSRRSWPESAWRRRSPRCRPARACAATVRRPAQPETGPVMTTGEAEPAGWRLARELAVALWRELRAGPQPPPVLYLVAAS